MTALNFTNRENHLCFTYSHINNENSKGKFLILDWECVLYVYNTVNRTSQKLVDPSTCRHS